MVAGDLVNTASRIQSAADPGTVFVGEATRRATEQAVVYEDAGAFELKGKEGLTPLWRALRVVSGARGTLKSTGLEAPFVGRDRELRPDQGSLPRLRRGAEGAPRLGHRDRRDRQVAPRLGVLQVLRRARRRPTYWHRGRCLAYGEGVTYWALADMVRMRCRIAEDEEPASALEKLRATLDEHIARRRRSGASSSRGSHSCSASASTRRATGRTCSRPGGSSSSGSPTCTPPCSRSRTCSGRTTSLLDFVEYLLEWSRNSPLYVITLARPELLERRPTWGAGQRNFSSLYLEPLPADGDGGAARRARARAARRAARPDPRPRRGRSAVRGRDGADAARPRAARPGGPGLPADGADRRARGAGDAARADRGPARRPVARGAAAAPGRRPCSARRSRERRSPRSRDPRPSSSRCSRRSCARRCSAFRPTRARPSTGSTASCRTSSGTSPTRRFRSASAGRGTWLRPST